MIKKLKTRQNYRVDFPQLSVIFFCMANLSSDFQYTDQNVIFGHYEAPKTQFLVRWKFYDCHRLLLCPPLSHHRQIICAICSNSGFIIHTNIVIQFHLGIQFLVQMFPVFCYIDLIFILSFTCSRHNSGFVKAMRISNIT